MKGGDDMVSSCPYGSRGIHNAQIDISTSSNATVNKRSNCNRYLPNGNLKGSSFLVRNMK